ncbi:MAG TPA: formylmethanofuran dehydrogenase [Candidatus Nanoarchaeia archaeon]|nr:formylmethanofuran dehydrogenase [Candidatus Nanoarchaeia archaeon]
MGMHPLSANVDTRLISMENICLELSAQVDNLCDYSFNFNWQDEKLDPASIIPYQQGSSYTYQDLVDALKSGNDVHIKGDVGARFAYSMGVDLEHFGGTGKPGSAGRVFVDGNVGVEAGMGMVSGILYVNGTIELPFGNIIEVVSDIEGYRKYRSITDIICNGLSNDSLIHNSLDDATLIINDDILRGTIGARMDCRGTVIVEGNAYNGTGLLMRRGTVYIKGCAGMNTGSRLDGGTVVVGDKADEFAGAYLKSGNLIFNDAKGYVGAGMTGGAIYSKTKVSVSPPAASGKKSGENSTMLRRVLDIGRLEAMQYHKYEMGPQKPEFAKVRMRDGSVIMRKV